MPGMFDKAVSDIGARHAEKRPNASTDWISLATEIGAVLIPMIKECLEKRRNAKAVAANAKAQPGMLRLAVRRHVLDSFLQESETGFDVRRKYRERGRDMVDSICESIEHAKEDDIAAVVQEVDNDA